MISSATVFCQEAHRDLALWSFCVCFFLKVNLLSLSPKSGARQEEIFKTDQINLSVYSSIACTYKSK